MNNLIDKYIYNVCKNLPNKIKSEVKEELESNIYDMLGDEYSYDNALSIIESLGDPKLLSDQYRNEARYVVSPKHYSEYILSLKMTMIIASILFFFFGAIIMLQRNVDKEVYYNVVTVLLGAFGLGVVGIILSYAVVTFAFQMLGLRKESEHKKWDVNELTEIPNEKSYLISKNNVLTKMALLLILGFIGLFILIFYPSINFFGLNFTFNESVTPVYIPLFFISVVMLIVKTVLKLRMERINYISSIYDTIYSLFTGIVVIIFILSDNVFTQSFYDAIDLNAFKITTIIISVFVGVMILLNIAFKWYKTAKNY